MVFRNVVRPGDVPPGSGLRNEIAALGRFDRFFYTNHAYPRRKPRHVEHAVPVYDFAELMSPETNVVSMIGLRFFIDLISAKYCWRFRVRDIPGAQRRMRPANIDAALRSLFLR